MCQAQDVQEGKAAQATFHGIMRELLADVRVRAAAGQLPDSTIAGHLLRIRQDGSDAGLKDDLLLPEVSVFFFGGGVMGSMCAGADTTLFRVIAAAANPAHFLMLPAGEDTSSNTSAWTLFLVSQHPEVEAKIVEELEQAGLLATPQQPEPRALQYGDLSRLSYLNMVIKARPFGLFHAISNVMPICGCPSSSRV